jgi:hypothetical protein
MTQASQHRIARSRIEAAVRCYAPSTSTVIALLFCGFLVLRHTAGHALTSVGLLTAVVIVIGVSGLAAGAIAVSAATIRRRRAAAGACHTCRHPCREAMHPLAKPEHTAPQWPHRPLTRTTLPIVDTHVTREKERVPW